jgi:hypothetical protein
VVFLRIDQAEFLNIIQKLVGEIHRKTVVNYDRSRESITLMAGILSDLLGCIKPSEIATELPSGIELFGDLFRWNTHPPTPAEPGNCDYVAPEAGQTSAGTVFETEQHIE